MKKIFFMISVLVFALAMAIPTAFCAEWKLVWNESENADGYYLVYWETENPSQRWSKECGNALEKPCVELNLEYGKKYTFVCHAYNSLKSSGPSDSLTFIEGITDERPPEKPELTGTEPTIPSGLDAVKI